MISIPVVLHLRKELVRPPAAVAVPGVAVRMFDLSSDLSGWLDLRARAMASQSPGVRPWTEADFLAEFVEKPWWRAESTWIAEDAGGDAGNLLGAVTLAMRDGAWTSVPVVHWLIVDPAWRRRGIGRLLLSHLERAAWNAGWREVQLETHAGWAAAVAFYHSMGYAPVRERSPS